MQISYYSWAFEWFKLIPTAVDAPEDITIVVTGAAEVLASFFLL